jgi:DNA-binding LacI/PurR family transcriptional regulator
MKRFKNSVRLTDVAAAAGVSLGTVSNVFNRPDIVRAQVRDEVMRIAAELGFSGPDPAGRLLMGGRANAIGVIPPGDMSVSFAVAGPYLNAVLRGVAEVCDQRGASLMLISGAEEQKSRAIREALVDGFILGHADEVPLVAARRRKVPFVVMDMTAGNRVDAVCIDGRGGAKQAAEHLLALGHRHFAIAAVGRRPADAVWHPPAEKPRRLAEGFPLDEEKLGGYAEALSSAGIAIDSVPLVEAYPPSPWAEAGARLLLERAPEATAILAMSDKNAVAVMTEAARLGRRIPADLSLVGFDDVDGMATLSPPLTTVRQDIVNKGRTAAQMLFDPTLPRRPVLPVELVVRGSTAPPRQARGRRR